MSTPRDDFIHALERRSPVGRVPHFELVFFLTMQAFGKVHPSHRSYHQWDQMAEKERALHRRDMADLFIDTARRFEHNAIFIHPNPATIDEECRMIDLLREISNDTYFLTLHGDATFGIPNGAQLEAFAYRLADDPAGVKREAQQMVDNALRRAETIRQHGGLDGFVLCSDYCFNDGPFISPNQFGEFVAPYLAAVVRAYRDMGFYVIKHTDGNIMPILDSLLQAAPHALHSLDPQGNVDMAAMKEVCGGEVCLIGNVNCGLMDTGTTDEVDASARYALQHGMPGGGYIFSTSNCIYTGMQLERYERILDIWRDEGNYAN